MFICKQVESLPLVQLYAKLSDQLAEAASATAHVTSVFLNGFN